MIGWIAAALPAAGFLAMVKIALGHSIPQTGGTAGEPPASYDEAGPADGREPSPDEWTDGDRKASDGPGTAARRPAKRRHRTGTVDSPDAAVRTDRTALEAAARAVHAALAHEGTPLTRDMLAARLRDAGHTVSNSRASDLVKQLRVDSVAVNGLTARAEGNE